MGILREFIRAIRKRSKDGKKTTTTFGIRSTYSTTITILVGDGETFFTVHEDLTCDRSSFLKAAVSGEWREAESKTIRLPDHDPSVFTAHLESVYACNADLYDLTNAYLDELVRDDEDKFENNCKLKAKIMHALVKLYILGDFLGDIHFKNSIIRGIITSANHKDTFCVEPAAIKMIFENTPSNSSIQRLIADAMACKLEKVKPEEVNETIDTVPTQAVPIILKAMAARRYGKGKRDDFKEENYVEDEVEEGA